MATPPLVLNQIGTAVSSDWSLTLSRVFVFDAYDGHPGYAAVYVASGGQTVLHDIAYITSFTRSRSARREPHIIETESGDTWQVRQAGCGCGSPLKKMNWTQVVNDYNDSDLVAQQEAPA